MVEFKLGLLFLVFPCGLIMYSSFFPHVVFMVSEGLHFCFQIGQYPDRSVSVWC